MNYFKNFNYKFYRVFAVFIFTISLIFQTGCAEGENTFGVENSEITDDKLLKVNYIDVGQADSILIQSPDGMNMLIDAGETKERAVINYLENHNVKKLDVVVATHPHNDHISEMSDVINSFDIGDFYMPKKQHTTKSFEEMINSLSAKNIKPKEAKAGVSFNLGKLVKGEIVAPCKSNYDDLNNWSAVIKLSYGDNSFLFTGDAEELSENEIISGSANIKSDVLKVGHHGSNSSTSEGFLKKVSPSYAVISAGKDNDYGHPHKETLDILDKYGVKVFKTYENGNITVLSDGKNINIDTDNEIGENDSQNKADIKDKNKSTEDLSNNGGQKSVYIGNKNSKKLHRPDCSSLPAEKNRVLFSSEEEALKQGYTLCDICKKNT